MTDPKPPTDEEIEELLHQQFIDIDLGASIRIGKLKDALRSLLTQRRELEARVRELEADRERLDWLDQQLHGPIFHHAAPSACWVVYDSRTPSWESKWHSADTLRAAIDAARAKEPR